MNIGFVGLFGNSELCDFSLKFDQTHFAID